MKALTGVPVTRRLGLFCILDTMEQFYVYGIWESKEDTGLPFYIGKGKNRRMYEHLNKRGKNKHKDRKIEKLIREDKNPDPRKIIDGISEEKAYDIEYLLINIHYDYLTNQSKDWGKGAGSGRENPFYGKTHTEEAKEKMSRYGKEHWMYGKSHSEETIEKMSQTAYERYEEGKHPAKGYEHTEEAKKIISKHSTGNNNPNAKLNEKEVGEIKWLVKNSDLTQKRIAETYSVSSRTVRDIRDRKTWQEAKVKKP